jgi:hypothetical protein
MFLSVGSACMGNDRYGILVWNALSTFPAVVIGDTPRILKLFLGQLIRARILSQRDIDRLAVAPGEPFIV